MSDWSSDVCSSDLSRITEYSPILGERQGRRSSSGPSGFWQEALSHVAIICDFRSHRIIIGDSLVPSREIQGRPGFGPVRPHPPIRDSHPRHPPPAREIGTRSGPENVSPYVPI